MVTVPTRGPPAAASEQASHLKPADCANWLLANTAVRLAQLFLTSINFTNVIRLSKIATTPAFIYIGIRMTFHTELIKYVISFPYLTLLASPCSWSPPRLGELAC